MMGCFCVQSVEALVQDDQYDPAAAEADPEINDEVVPAIYTWLSSNLLPAPDWAPDPAWLEIDLEDLPDPPMPPEALSVIITLVQAYHAAQDDLGLDLTDPDDTDRLTRIVGTLNRRMPLFEAMVQDTRPWEQVALYNDQLDLVRVALETGLIPEAGEQEVEQGPPVGPYKPLIRKLRALAPLIAAGQLLKIDYAEPDATETLAKLVRTLRKINLPPLDDTVLVLRTIARVGAVARLRQSFGADPRAVPFERVTRALDRKAADVQQILPETVRVAAGQLLGMPRREPNPSQWVNADIIARAQTLQPDQMRWQPPPFDQFDLLTVGAPVMTLSRVMSTLTPQPIRSSPCGYTCDAGAVGRSASPGATASPGSGTGAGRAR